MTGFRASSKAGQANDFMRFRAGKAMRSAIACAGGAGVRAGRSEASLTPEGGANKFLKNDVSHASAVDKGACVNLS